MFRKFTIATHLSRASTHYYHNNLKRSFGILSKNSSQGHLTSEYTVIDHTFDAIIVGAGASGLRAALGCAEAGLKTACISKSLPTKSDKVSQWEGINAAISRMPEDDWQYHFYDTMKAADYLADVNALHLLCREAPKVISELESFGMPFSRTQEGKIEQKNTNGQYYKYGKGGNARRSCFAGSFTGQALVHKLFEKASNSSCSFFPEHFALDLLTNNGECHGIMAYNLADGIFHRIRAKQTILATGNCTAAFQSGLKSTGDGNAMATRAGFPLQDLEFVQFNPTGLYGTNLIIPEDCRWEGGVLRNALGQNFMQRYAPSAKDTAKPEYITRAIMREIEEGRGCGPNKDHVYLYLDQLPREVLKEKLSDVVQMVKTFADIDIQYQAIPVFPTVQSTLGGIPTNYMAQALTIDEKGVDRIIPGLMAVGGAASPSVYGAMALEGNSLLNSVVFGRAAALKARELINPFTASITFKKKFKEIKILIEFDDPIDKQNHLNCGASIYETPLFLKNRRRKRAKDGETQADLPKNAGQESIERFDRIRHSNGLERPGNMRASLQKIMQKHAGLVRDEKFLNEGCERLSELYQQYHDIGTGEKGMNYNIELCEALELENLLLNSLQIMHAAENRKESRGCHQREDFLERNDQELQKHSLTWMKNMTNGGKVEMKYRELSLESLDNNEFVYSPPRVTYY